MPPRKSLTQGLKAMLATDVMKLMATSSFHGRGLASMPLISPLSQMVGQSRVGLRSISTCTAALEKKTDRIELSAFIGERNTFGFGNTAYGKYDKVSPQTVSPRRDIPDGILTPDYFLRKNGISTKPLLKNPHIKTSTELDLMRESCRLTRYIMEKTLDEAKPGVSTDELDKYAHQLAIKSKAFPSTLNYRKFPKSICTSVNNVACHGIPDSRKLVSGDILTIDVMIYKNGFHGDCAATELIGKVDKAGYQLVDVAEACLVAGVQQCGPGKPFRNIGKAIEKIATSNGYAVIHGMTGHGIGKNPHEKPDVYHYDHGVQDSEIMKPGMTFTIEPIITQGMDLYMVLNDGWTAVTVDGARTAQFEHTILITETGFEILTECEGY